MNSGDKCDKQLTICCFTNANGFSANSVNVACHTPAVRLNPVPGTQFGTYFTASRQEERKENMVSRFFKMRQMFG